MRLLGRRISKKKAATNEFGGGVGHAIKKPKQKKSANMKAVNISELPVPVTVDLPHAVSVFNQTTRPSSSSNNNQAKNLSAAQTPRKAMSPLKADYLSSSGKVRRHKLKTDSKLFTPEKSFLTPTPEMSPAKTVNNNIPSPVKVSSMIVLVEKEFVEENEDNLNEVDNNINELEDIEKQRKYADVTGKLDKLNGIDNNENMDMDVVGKPLKTKDPVAKNEEEDVKDQKDHKAKKQEEEKMNEWKDKVMQWMLLVMFHNMTCKSGKGNHYMFYRTDFSSTTIMMTQTPQAPNHSRVVAVKYFSKSQHW